MLKAILADVIHFATPKAEAEVRMAELEELTRTYGGLAVVKTIQRRARPDYVTFLGSGKVEEIVKTHGAHGAGVLVINEILKPGQIFYLEEALAPVKMKVWDRIDLILHIFDKHARSAEAKLQIELARLRHMGPRIYNLGSQLGRQRGGTGTRGGSGEGNTEAMKRHLRETERRVVDRLRAFEGQHALQRQNRARQNFASVALVGYTNAGKTSLLNALTKRRELAADKLFATLDTRVGRLRSPRGQEILLSDTIGFIRDLPPGLIQAFRSTLSEAVHADLILHVIDAADERSADKIHAVEEILHELGIGDRPRLNIYTKADLLSVNEQKSAVDGFLVSVQSKFGVPELEQYLVAHFSPSVVPMSQAK